MEVATPGDLGRALRQRRKHLRLTQQDLADVAGVSVRFLSDLESGKPTVQTGMVMDVARALGYRLDLVIAERS